MTNDTTFHSKLEKTLIFIAVTVCYFLLGWGSLHLATINDFSSPIWIPSGFAIGILFLFGNWLAPAIFLGAFFTNLTVTSSIPSLMSIGAGNMLEAIVGAFLIRWVSRTNSFKSYNEILAIVAASAISSLVSASIGIMTLISSGHTDPTNYQTTFYTWWSGDAIGSLIFLPLFFEIHQFSNKHIHVNFKKIIWTALFSILFLIAIYFVFIRNYNPAFVWLACPLLIFAALFLDRIVSRIALIISTLLIVGLTTIGYAPFEFGSLNLNLIFVQCLLTSYAFSVLFVKPVTADFRLKKSFIFSNIFGWSIIFFVIFIVAKLERERIDEDLYHLVHSSLQDINTAADKYELLLAGGAALISAKPNLTAQEWHEYQRDLKLETKFDAIQGFGFVRSYKKKDEAKFKAEVAKRGIKTLPINILNQSYSAKFNDRFVLLFMEPFDHNQKAIGIDIGSDEVRRQAAEKARDNNQIMATEKISLVQSDNTQAAFGLYYPVWTPQNEFLGWTVAPIVTSTFFNKTLSSYSHHLQFRINRGNQTIFSNYANEKARSNQAYLKKLKMKIFGGDHTIEIYPSSSFFQLHSYSVPIMALLMTLFMLIFAEFQMEQLNFSQRTERLVLKRTLELEASKIQLINSSKMASLGEMASSMGHEINNPLTIIHGKIIVLRMMLEDFKIDNLQINNEINKIEETTSRISKIVKALKSFSRAAQADPFELIPMETIIQETLDLCSERMKANGITLTIDPIPELCIFCRPSQISQVFFNLLSNSSDAIASMQIKTIEIKFEIKEPDRLFIYITDSGHGIPPDIAVKIMEPFFTTKRVGKGTGLGLSIAKGIIETHEGTIWLDSKSAHTRFVIELPIKNVELA